MRTARPLIPEKGKGACGGYTLLETVIALSILTAVAVPLFSMFSRALFIGDARRELTATWLCAQEAECLAAYPGRAVPVRYRYIDGREWSVKTVTTGTAPVRYELTAGSGGKDFARLFFYGTAENADR